MIRLELGDALQVIPRLVAEGVQVDSVVTDPPYHLTARTERFGAVDAAPPKYGRDGAMGRLSKGFMGKEWDGGDVAFRPETWAAIASVMRPGAFLLSFGGTRTYHRVASAIEDAGFVIQDCIMWLYGTGFPKRRDMLKPAYEPIIVAYKPGGGRTMQIDECRISASSRPLIEGDYKETDSVVYAGRVRGDESFRGGSKATGVTDLGRWPANICHDGSDEVVEMFPSSTAREPGSVIKRSSAKGWKENALGLENREPGSVMTTYGDSGSAARFFWSSKAGKKDRNGSLHPTVKPISLLDWLVPLVTPVGGTVLDPFAGTGTTGVAATNCGRHAVLIERDEGYFSDIQKRFDKWQAWTQALTANSAARAALMAALQDRPL